VVDFFLLSHALLAPSRALDSDPVPALATFSLFREELRRALRELRGGRLSPARGAAAVALGLFVGAQPVFGCHLPIVVFACLWLRLDALIAYVAANISNPLFVAALLTAEVQIGALLRTGSLLRFSRALTRADAFAGFAGDLALGAPVLGLGLAVVGGAVTFVALAAAERLRPRDAPPAPYRLPPGAPPWVQAVERVAGRYAPSEGATAAERSRFHYVRTKLLGDPVAKLVAGVEGEEGGALGEVLDIGTGRGQLPVLLLELGRATRAHGVDWDLPKIEAARRAADAAEAGSAPLDVTFEAGDARAAELPPADTVMLIDVLHYFTIEEQDALLARAAAAVRAGGRLLVREADTERGWRSAVTLVEERIFTATRFNRGERVRMRPAREIAARLEEAGLACEVRPAWGRTPFSNVLIVGRRPR
jgi:uncharacterized protein (DUF2062 family)/SAM-dependent methyltransferase